MAIKNTTDPALSTPKSNTRTPQPLPRFMRESEVLQHLRVSKSTVWRLVAADKLKVLRISKRVTLFCSESIESYLADCKDGGAK